MDHRDEERWVIEARKKQVRREISAITAHNLGASGGEQARERLNYLSDTLDRLEGKDPVAEKARESWDVLRLKGRG